MGGLVATVMIVRRLIGDNDWLFGDNLLPVDANLEPPALVEESSRLNNRNSETG